MSKKIFDDLKRRMSFKRKVKDNAYSICPFCDEEKEEKITEIKHEMNVVNDIFSEDSEKLLNKMMNIEVEAKTDPKRFSLIQFNDSLRIDYTLYILIGMRCEKCSFIKYFEMTRDLRE